MRAYVEIDFEEVIGRKQHVISQHGLTSPTFMAADLEMDFGQTTLPRLMALLDKSCTTLVLAECCLVYLHGTTVNVILRSLSEALPDVHLVIFDPLYLGDPFGRTMVRNLSGLPIQESLERYPTPASYIQRIEQLGWKGAIMTSLAELAKEPQYRDWMARKAPLDEYEQWEIITKHYFILTAHN